MSRKRLDNNLMKVCFLNHDLSDKTGAGRFCLSLVAAIKEIHPNVEYRVITHEWVKRIISLRRIFKHYDVVHALDGWPYGFVAVLATRGLGIRVVITAIGTGAVKPLYQPIKKHLLTWAYRRADAVTAISNNTKREILKVVPGLDIKVINHGVDFQKFQNTKSKLQMSKPYILSVGAWKPRKGYKYSIAAFELVEDKFPDLKYVIVGNAPEEVKNKYNRIRFLNDLSEEELVSLYRNAELFVLLPVDDNHDIEGFGLVFLEAAAAGLAVIGTRESGAEDAVLDGQNGFLVPPRSSEQAAEAITKILSDGELKNRFSEKSREFAKNMSWAKAAGQYLAIY